ncbi:hypothetical protein CNMCM8980_005580 [Aspergillus fumigatiaffinis]|uniref:BTB domain-containing protein n=1 Tax=Aspergillus fumigatiaffinis TaxID=340414 RepID=A0A8H4M589_9EURO|nr:hypothetical protein CNMCM6805_001886 [Aspergillus fumigatiaffinis]KAF4237357.1 hypothetical protein CNMCM6457_001262 [Aspergillus fumigatiaffinis]KAF4251711.1 hypothetical protein CNMCM8980_005580 [Aspergillus fumigatiaffinis]
MAVPICSTQVPHEDIEVSVAGDFTIHINEFDPAIRRDERSGDDADEAGANGLVRTASLKVQKGILLGRSQYFRTMFDGRWAHGPKDDSVVLNEDTVRSMELWLRVFHSAIDALPKQSISVEEVWHAIMAGDKYGFDLQVLKSWFIAWYKEMKNERGKKFFNEFAPRLLFPCYAFDYAVGFQELTKFITYNEPRHIMEVNPTHHLQMHLRPRIIQQLNAAKGRLRTILHQALFKRVNEIIDRATCDCKEQTIFDFLKELRRIDVSPLDLSSNKASVAQMLARLRQYDETKTRSHALSSTDTSVNQSRQSWCSVFWLDGKTIVRQAIARVSGYFDGLCLDCMDRTKDLQVERSKDQDYWFHNQWEKFYDRDCRISHGEPTWYFSFMGRKEKRGLIAE